jgi:NADP-reducing hydrogenase subunit HndD
MIKLTINGNDVEVEEGATLLDAARAAGVHVPTLCHSPRFPPRAVCRLCVVDVEGHEHPQPACATKARPGDVVETDAPALRDFRTADARMAAGTAPE